MKTILVASSDAEVHKLMERELSQKYAIRTVKESGDALLKIFKEGVDLIIIDTELKGISGLKTVEILKSCCERVPLIVLSKNTSVKTGSKIMEKGVFYYLPKPLNPRELKKVVESAFLIKKGGRYGKGCNP